MAQTKKKRSTKHRGNAAGMVEARGRTGRKLTEDEKKASAKASAKPGARKQDSFDRPPSWRGAANRSLIAVVIFVAILVLFFKQSAPQAIGLGAVMLLLYIPLSYYTDLVLYRRRLKQKGQTPPAKPKKDAKGE